MAAVSADRSIKSDNVPRSQLAIRRSGIDACRENVAYAIGTAQDVPQLSVEF